MKKLILIAGLILLMTPTIVSADGGIFPPPDFWVYETGQKAVIFHDNDIETLILSVTFRGDAEDFGWVIPTPSQPKVEKSTDELFTALRELTRPEIDYRPMPMYEELGAVPVGKGVEVIETKKVEYYDITILSADDPEALSKWLNENGYQFPTEASYLLEDYINNKWYFTAVKISTEVLGEEVEEQLQEGHAVPLKLTFASSKIVYPLKITGIAEYFKRSEATLEETEEVSEEDIFPSNCASHDECAGLFCPQVVGQDTPCCMLGVCICGPSDCHETMPVPSIEPSPWIRQPEVSILLYIFADHKKDLPGFNIDYANWIKSKEIENLAVESGGEPWMEPAEEKYYLTRLSDYMQPAEMTYDLYPRDASDNKPVGVKKVEWQNLFAKVVTFLIVLTFFLILLIVSPAGIIFIACALIHFFTKSKVGHVLAWIFQGLVFLITLLLGILWLVARNYFVSDWSSLYYGYINVSYGKSIFASALTAWVLFLVGMIAVMVWQILRQRGKK